MARPRKQMYTMDMYLNKVQNGDISNDANVQRNYVWTSEQKNELIATVLTDDYIPPIILGEEDSSQLRIADGGQRTATFQLFKYGNYKITTSIEKPIIPYKKKIIDENGKISWEDAEFNIKNKTYEKLPDELKKVFNEYQIETVIHEHCDMHKISEYIKKYNNHTPMNVNQKAFTYLDNFAENVRSMMNKPFFIDHSSFTESEKNKGVVERALTETVMCMFHLDEWKKSSKANNKYLNEYADEEEFDKLADNLDRLEKIVDDDTKTIFDSKNSFIFLTLFNKFTELGLRDEDFGLFLKKFKHSFRENSRNADGQSFDEIDKVKSTKDKGIIRLKLNMLTELMYKYLGISGDVIKEDDILNFVKENVSEEITQEDIEFYKDCLNDMTKDIDKESRILDKYNLPSMLCLTAHSILNETDQILEEWLNCFAKESKNYIKDQKKNYEYIRDKFDLYVSKEKQEQETT